MSSADLGTHLSQISFSTPSQNQSKSNKRMLEAGELGLIHFMFPQGGKTLNTISESRCLAGGCIRTTVVSGRAAHFPSVSCPQELLPKSHRIMDQNILSGQEPPGSSSPTPGPVQDTQQSHPVPQSVVQTLRSSGSLGVVPTALCISRCLFFQDLHTTCS